MNLPLATASPHHRIPHPPTLPPRARGWYRSLVFDSFRQSLEDLINRATPPEERRAAVARMRDTLVQAKAGVHDLRDALEKSRKRAEVEERELETVRRRRQLAEGIGDAETVQIATRYEQVHAERVEIVRRKIAAQEAELALAEREVDEMSAELKAVVSGTAGSQAVGGGPDVTTPDMSGADADADAAGDADGAGLREQIDSLARARARADREAEAQRRLEELKRRMGK